jgi:hypothetical protein
VSIHESLNLFSKLGGLSLLLLKFVGVLLLEVFQDFLVMQKKIMKSLLELLGFLLFLGVKLLVSLVVCLLFVGVVLLPASQLLLVGHPHLPQFLVVHSLHFTLLVFESGLSLLEVDAFSLNICFDSLDILFPGEQSVLHPCLIFILELLD